MKVFTILFSIFFSVLFNSQFSNAQTYFSDDFETGLSKWTVGGNNWDTLSTTYSSSNHCVTDSRIGNYAFNSDPTITMSQILNLSSTTHPVLAFFHRYSLHSVNCGFGTTYDYAYLEVSTNGGFNWNQIKLWNLSNTAWTHEQFDLSNYKTNLVKVRFRLSSHNCNGGVADGWYIDDVKIQENNTLNPTYSIPFSDNFENGLSKWFVGGFNWDTTSTNPNSGLYSLADSKFGNYTYNSDPTITISGVLNLTYTTLPVLTFFHRYSLHSVNCGFGTTYDRVYLEISTNGGFTWSQLQSWLGTNTAWTYEQFDLSNYRYDRVKIRYRVSSHNCNGGSADGAYLDDVSIFDLSQPVINLNLTTLMEGLYDPVSNKTARNDIMRVYLRRALSPYAMVDSAKGIIDTVSFSGLFSFDNASSGTYYIVAKHFNSIETWSKPGGEPLVRGGSTYNYNFTTAASQAYGSNLIQVDASPVRFAFYSGDVNQDGIVDLDDNTLIDNDSYNFITGYVETDLNGDNAVDISDATICDNNAFNYRSVVRP